MAILKVSPSAMHEIEETYVVVPSSSIALYKSVEAAAVHVYLLDRPEDWIIRETEVTNRFKGLGRRRFRSALRELKSVGLLRSIRIRDEVGAIVGHQYDLFAHAWQNPAISTGSGTDGDAISTALHPMESAPDAECADLHIDRFSTHKQINTHADSSGKKSKRTRDIPIEVDLTDTSWASDFLGGDQ